MPSFGRPGLHRGEKGCVVSRDVVSVYQDGGGGTAWRWRWYGRCGLCATRGGRGAVREVRDEGWLR